MYERIRDLLTGFKRPTMGLVLGASSCRYVLLADGSEVFREPSVLIRSRKDNKIIHNESAIGDAVRNINTEWGRTTETVFPFDDGLQVGGYSLQCMLRYFRKRIAERRGCRGPARLVVTGRPSLLDLLSRFIEEDARKAGFRACTIVEEYVCLAAAAGAERSVPLLLIDVGHTGTRVYGCRGGVFVAEAFADVRVGGKQMAEAIIRGTHGRLCLEIGTATANRLLIGMSDPFQWPSAIKGRHVLTGLPRSHAVDLHEVANILRPLYDRIAETCRAALVKLKPDPPDHVRVVLAGEAAASSSLRDQLEQRLGVAVELPHRPEELSIRGLVQLNNTGLLASASGLGVVEVPTPAVVTTSHLQEKMSPET